VVTSRQIAALAKGLGAQDLAPLATTGGEHGSTTTGGHTGAEAVRLRTLPDIRLVRPFHVSSSMRPSGSGAKPDDYMRRVSAVSMRWSLHARPGCPPERVYALRLALACAGESAGHAERRPESTPPKLVGNLWILWKTQDSRLWNLWTTLGVALFARSPLCYYRPHSTRSIAHLL